jgi:hypothetical protein
MEFSISEFRGSDVTSVNFGRHGNRTSLLHPSSIATPKKANLQTVKCTLARDFQIFFYEKPPPGPLIPTLAHFQE